MIQKPQANNNAFIETAQTSSHKSFLNLITKNLIQKPQLDPKILLSTYFRSRVRIINPKPISATGQSKSKSNQ